MARIKGLKDKHKDIVGKRPRKTDYPQWSEAKFLKWFGLIHFFTVDSKLSVTDISIKAFQQRVADEPLWEEWMWRFEIAGNDYAVRTFLNQLLAVNGSLGAYLQSNPHAITNDMKDRMMASPYLEKYTEPFAIKKLDSGAEVVTTNQEGGKYALPEVQYHKAMLKLSSLANELVSGITKDDLRKMSPEARIKLADKLINTMSKLQGGHRPNIQIFKQLIVNAAGKDDLEAALVEMSKTA